MRYGLVALWLLFCSMTAPAAQVSVGIGLPGVSIGINLPVYPELVPVPGYPVYYAPQVPSNYFYYDGMYWVYQRDNWYTSSWYNGPWGLVVPEAVPLYVLRIPVRYYRQPPAYFHGWAGNAPPRWGEHWGNAWERRRHGWDTWSRSAVPRPAPLPVYQRQYSGNRYPGVEQQQALQRQNYRYQPQAAVVQHHVQPQPVQSAPVSSPQGRPGAPQGRISTPQDPRNASRPTSLQQGGPPAARGQPPQAGGGDVQRPTAAPPHQQQQQRGQFAQQQRQPPQQPPQGAPQHEQQAHGAQGQNRQPQGNKPAQKPGPGHENGQDKGDERGGGHK